MTSAISPKNGILEIKLYEGGKSHLAGVENVLKLSSNENPFGPSDRAKEAVARSTHELQRYHQPITLRCAKPSRRLMDCPPIRSFAVQALMRLSPFCAKPMRVWVTKFFILNMAF